jgi:hypothetical protein
LYSRHYSFISEIDNAQGRNGERRSCQADADHNLYGPRGIVIPPRHMFVSSESLASIGIRHGLQKRKRDHGNRDNAEIVWR